MDQSCRLCRKSCDVFFESIFEYREGQQISEIVMKVCPIQIDVNDSLPKVICEECLEIVFSAHELQKISVESDYFYRAESAESVTVKTESLEPFHSVKIENYDEVFKEEYIERSSPETEVKLTAIKTRHRETNSNKTVFNPRLLPESKSLPSQDRWYLCNFCNIKLKPRSNVLRHMMLIHDPLLKPFACVYCIQRFETEDLLKIHERSKHSNESEAMVIFCDICGASGNNQEGMDRHKKDDHSPEGKEVEFEEDDESAKVIKRCRNKFNPRPLPGFENKSYDDVFYACSFCDKQLKPRKNMLRHIRLKHDPDFLPFGCAFCIQRFKNSRSLDAHQTEHEDEMVPSVFVCELCGITGDSYEGMEIHKSDDHQISNSFIEEKKVSHQVPPLKPRRKRGDHFNPRALPGYEDLKYDDVFYQCSFCDKQLKPRKNMLRHIRNKHDPELLPFPCRFCIERFETSSELQAHENRSHERRHRQFSVFFCDLCGVTGDNKEGFEHHMEDDHMAKMKSSDDSEEQSFDCNQCNTSFKKIENLKHHIARSHQETFCIKCTKCQEVFKNSKQLRNHSMLVHDKLYRILPADEVEQDLKCCGCGKSFENGLDLMQHVESHRGPDGRSYKNLKCSHCPAPIKTFEIFLKHAKHHMKKKTHECLRCKKRGAFDGTFIAHLKGHKRKYQKKAECDKCGNKFRNLKDLEMHIKVKHEQQTLFICPICAKSLGSPTILDNHIKYVHNGDLQKKHTCRVCAQKFTHKSKLMRHEATHSTHRPHVCELCGAGFKMKEGLTVHMKRHSGTLVKKYSCRQCKYKFTTQHRLTAHLLTHSGAKPYQCEYCDRAYASKGDLIKHLQKVHVGNSVYKCQKCPEAFPRIVELREHLLVHAEVN